MERDVFRQTLMRIKQIEQDQGLENFLIASTNFEEKHSMRMKEDYISFSKQMSGVYQDLSELELADLFDEQKFVGGFDGEFD